MLITYCLTVRLLARQHQSLCGGGPTPSGTNTTNGNQQNGWGSGWLGQQNLGINHLKHFLHYSEWKWNKSSFGTQFFIRKSRKFHPKVDLSNFVDISFFFIYVSIMIFRATLHVASFIENQFTINAKSSAFSYINRYRAFKFRYTWIMVARLKVNIYILFSLFFIHFFRAAPVTKSLIWKQKKKRK